MGPQALIAATRAVLERHASGIACAWIFGSLARGEATERSDIDLAMLYCDEPPPTLEGLGLDLAQDIETATGRTVDPVVLNRAPPDLVHRVLRDGMLVLETDRQLFELLRYELALPLNVMTSS